MSDSPDRLYAEERARVLAQKYEIGGATYRIKPPSLRTMAEAPRELDAIIKQIVGGSGKDDSGTIVLDLEGLGDRLRDVIVRRLPNLIALAIVPEGKKWTPEIAAETASAIIEHDLDLDPMVEIAKNFIDSSPLAKRYLSELWQQLKTQIMSALGGATEIAERVERTISTLLDSSQTATPSNTPPSATTSPMPPPASSPDGSATSESDRRPTTV